MLHSFGFLEITSKRRLERFLSCIQWRMAEKGSPTTILARPDGPFSTVAAVPFVIGIHSRNRRNRGDSDANRRTRSMRPCS